MKITIYILNRTGEVYQRFIDVDSAIRWLLRTGYLKQRTLIAQKGTNAHVWEDCNDLKQLQKEVNNWLFAT